MNCATNDGTKTRLATFSRGRHGGSGTVPKPLSDLLHERGRDLHITPLTGPVGWPGDPTCNAVGALDLLPRHFTEDQQFRHVAVGQGRIFHWANLQQGMLGITQEDIVHEHVVFAGTEAPVVSGYPHRHTLVWLGLGCLNHRTPASLAQAGTSVRQQFLLQMANG